VRLDHPDDYADMDDLERQHAHMEALEVIASQRFVDCETGEDVTMLHVIYVHDPDDLRRPGSDAHTNTLREGHT
jgi:hypothetical protein